MKNRFMAALMALTLIVGILPCVAFAGNAAETVEFYNAANSVVTELGEEEAVYAKISFIAPKDGTAVILAAHYDDKGALLNTQILDNKNMTAGENVELQTPEISVSETDTLKIFAWDGIGTMVPILNDTHIIKNTSTGDGGGGFAGEDDVLLTATNASAVVSSGVSLENSTDELSLSVTPLDESSSDVETGDNETISSIDVHVSGIAQDNSVPVLVTVEKFADSGLNSGNLQLYHVENDTTNKMTQVDSEEELDTHNEFCYDPEDGTLTMALASFSEIAVVSDTENMWNGTVANAFNGGTGTEADPYIIANADQLAYLGDVISNENDTYTSAYYKLVNDINIGGSKNYEENGVVFYPIGYNKVGGQISEEINWYTYGGSFKGVFDGTGHTISGIYQNTWIMKGDYDGNYYNAAMGLFGYVNGGTVKNLTIDTFQSDGEFAPTGCVAAYARNSTFENIALTNCNPRVYNTGNGGIVGVGGSSDDTEDAKLVFKNITIDNTNKITALWGSWDVACGGLVGMFRGAGSVDMTNCHIAAQIDVYNDVCGNYQYYWYRYAGMLIGTNKNMTTNDEGYTVPETDKFKAENCTVHFGEWNDYYYCELVANSLASYTHDHQFSRLEQVDSVDTENMTVTVGGETTNIPTTGRYNYVVVNGEAATENAACYHFVDGAVWNHEAAGYETTDIDGDGNVDSNVLKEDKQHYYLPFNQLFTGYGWGVQHIPIYNDETENPFEGVTILDREVADSVEKFETKFTGDFLYRVGNQNPVSLASLFGAKDGATINDSGVYVSIDKVDENTNVSGTYTANTTDWKQGTIQFSGTGPVKVTIQDYDYCIPTVLYLEVIEAKNVTSLESATSNNVVLLNDVSGGFTVSGGYTLHGNGFKVTLPTTYQSNYSSGYVGYVYLSGGNLDNVQIVGPVYPEFYMYRDQAQDLTDTTKANYFYNSVLINSGNCTISNSYISGSRTAVCIRGGNNVVLDNTTLSGGAYANMQIAGASSVTLRDLTTVQTDIADSYGKEKTAHGLGISVDSAVVDIYIEGELNQYNWLNKEQWNAIVPSNYQSSFPDFFGSNTFSKYWHYLNGGTEPYVNMAFIYACNWDTSTINDKRETVNYDTCDATIAGVDGGVYSKINTVGGNAITDTDLAEPEYISSGFYPIAPVFKFDNTANADEDDADDAADTYCVYEEDSGILRIGITGNSKTIDLSGVSVTKNGTALTHTAYLNGTQISGDSVTIKVGDGTRQKLTFNLTTTDCGYDNEGTPITGSIEYTWTVTVVVATLAYPAPEWNMSDNYTFTTSNCYYAYYQTSQGYGEAVPIYEGVKVNYYNKSGTLVELDLSGTTTLPTGSNNANANAFTYTLSDGSVLTMKFVSGWKSGATTHQFTAYNSKAYIYPQSLDNDNYVRAKTTNQDFNVKISYTFTDPNGQSTETVTMNWYNAAASNGSVSTVQWKTFDSTNGKEPECITPETLITLADGSQKQVQHLTGEEELLVWNLETGAYDTAPIVFIDTDETSEYEVINISFSDGSEVGVIYEHGFFDLELGEYVYINRDNAEDYIGHKFVKQADIENNTWDSVVLEDVVIEKKLTQAYSPVTFEHLCYYTDGVLSMPGGIDGLFNIFEVDTKIMAYNAEKMAEDIENYGLFVYADFEGLISEVAYEAFNGDILKVAIGKGMLTWEDIEYLAERYMPLVPDAE